MVFRSRLPRVWFVLLSFTLWTTWELARHGAHPFHDLSGGSFTDHFSHMNAARIFPRIGADIWRKSYQSMFPRPSREAIARLPKGLRVADSPDLRAVPGWNPSKPLVASWSHNPRLYPPGDMLLVAPVALLYHFTALSFAHAALLLIILFLAYAHLAIYAATSSNQYGVPLLAFLLLYFEIIHWTLEGFYDAATIFPLILCATYLRQRRALAATVAYCAAVLIHFRALFLLPWGAYGAWMIIRERQWSRWAAPEFLAAAAGLLMVAAAAGPFLLLWPTLSTLPIGNVISIAVPRPNVRAIGSVTVIMLLSGWAFAWARSWLDVVVLGWFAFMLVSLRQTEGWHLLVPLAWVVAPVVRARPSVGGTPQHWAVFDARILLLLFVGAFVFGWPPLPTWLTQVF